VRRASARPQDLHPVAERPVPDAVNDAFRRVIRWRVGRRCPLGLVARQAVADAVAAEVLRARFPEEAARLERSWRTAVHVRRRLHDLGPEAEQVALRMLPTWRLPLKELPGVARAVTRPAPDSVPEGSRRSERGRKAA
jgi:hypothetical protein